MIKQDWMERQIEIIGRTLGYLLKGKRRIPAILEDFEEYDLKMEESILETIVTRCLAEGDIKTAQDLIFSAINSNQSQGNLFIALCFYSQLIERSDDDLAKQNLSRDKIGEQIDLLEELYQG